MKNIILLFTILLFTGFSEIKAQHSHYNEVIHLKDGTIIKGVIIEQVPEQFIKVRTKDRQEIVYQSSEVASITKEFFETKKKGYINITEIGMGVGPDNVAYSFSTVNGYLLKPHFSIGAGAGYDHYMNTGSMIPLFLDMRIVLHDRRITPFIYGDGGYSIAVSSNTYTGFKSGPMFNPGFGIKTFVGKSTTFLLSFGIRIQDMRYNIPDPAGNLVRTNTYSQLFIVKAGFRF